MNKAELIKALEPYPDTMSVFIDERLTDFRYGLVNGVKAEQINFMEDVEGHTLAQDKVIILSEE